jgi:Protein of unknown function (DUF3830)
MPHSAAFKGLLPCRNKIIQARWSGESAWIPLGDFKLGVGYENHTSHSAPGEILLYPGGFSETEDHATTATARADLAQLTQSLPFSVSPSP